MFVSLKRIFRSAWQSFSRDGGSIAANIFILVMTVSVITSLFLFKDISQFLIYSLEEKVDVSVYFKYEVPEEDILDVRDDIFKISEVKEVEYVSKEEALEVFTERHKDDPLLMESLAEVGTNPFLAALNIKAYQASQYQSVVAFLEGADFTDSIEKIDYHERKPVIDRIFSLTSTLNKFGIAISLILVIVAILVAFNTIRLAIYNSREEIKIQRLVGASNWFIRGPFLAQGVISGLFAALICLLLFTILTFAFNSTAKSLFSDLDLFSLFVANFWVILLIQLVSGIGLGIVSSFIAIRRYLKV